MTIEGTARVLIADLVGGSTALAARPDYDRAALVLFVGSDPVVSHGHTVAMPNPRGKLREMRSPGRDLGRRSAADRDRARPNIPVTLRVGP